MSKFILAAEKIQRAMTAIQKARDLPIPAVGGKFDFSYIARVKAHLQEARDLVKFIPRTVGVSVATKEQVKEVYEIADQVERELLH